MTQKMMTRDDHWTAFKRLSVEMVTLAFRAATAETKIQRQQSQWCWNAARMKRLGHLKAALELQS